MNRNIPKIPPKINVPIGNKNDAADEIAKNVIKTDSDITETANKELKNIANTGRRKDVYIPNTRNKTV
jgi:hypothetical protein